MSLQTNIKISNYLNDISKIGDDFDDYGFYSLSNQIDAVLKALAQDSIPAVKTADAITILTAMTTASNKLLTELSALKTQNSSVLPPETYARMQSTNNAVGNAVSRLNKLLQSGML